MSETTIIQPTPTAQAIDPADLLQRMLANLGDPKKAKARIEKEKKASKAPEPLTVGQAFNEAHSGYRNWKAEARVVQIQEQACGCCGTRTKAVKDEFYRFSHAASKSVWFRHEGYGIEAPDDLPIYYEDLPPRVVTACASCRLPDTDLAIHAILNRTQRELPL